MEKNAKMLAAIGSLLICLVMIPGVHFISLVGLILFLVGIYQLSSVKQDKTLFQEALWAFLIPTVGGIVLAIGTAIVSVIGIGMGGMTREGWFESERITHLLTTGMGMGILLLGIVVLVGAWVLGIIFGAKMQKVSLSLDQHFPHANFRLAGSFFFWGGWLSIILVGALLIWIAWLLYTLTFFSLPEENPHG
ncbi:MAG: DUF996 domain-containing protein [Brevinematales bacterium]|nr:DUF996 domain-containing protein [Brevinematales bacterium]